MIRSLTVVSIAAICSPALAQGTADFDSLSEGFYGTSLYTNGITFSNVNDNSGLNPDGSFFSPGDYGTNVTIEQAGLLANDYAEVSPSNVLGWGNTYIAGDNLTINLLTTLTMTPDATSSSAELDLFYFQNGPWGGIDIHFDALDAVGTVVARDTVTISDLGGRDSLVVHHFSVLGVEFESVVLHAQYADGTNTVLAGVMDNVVISAPPACPADINGDGFVDNGDISAFVGLFLASDLAADFNGDGFLDGGDINMFIGEFLAGC